MHADTFYSVALFSTVVNRWAAPDVVFMDYSLSPASPIKLLSEEKEKERSRGRMKSEPVNNRIGKDRIKNKMVYLKITCGCGDLRQAGLSCFIRDLNLADAPVKTSKSCVFALSHRSTETSEFLPDSERTAEPPRCLFTSFRKKRFHGDRKPNANTLAGIPLLLWDYKWCFYTSDWQNQRQQLKMWLSSSKYLKNFQKCVTGQILILAR